jgi:hypothetical protein
MSVIFWWAWPPYFNCFEKFLVFGFWFLVWEKNAGAQAAPCGQRPTGAKMKVASYAPTVFAIFCALWVGQNPMGNCSYHPRV